MEVLAPVQGMQPRAAIACSAPAAGAAFDVLPLAPVVRAVIGAEEPARLQRVPGLEYSGGMLVADGVVAGQSAQGMPWGVVTSELNI